ncbi:hypothetical protein INR49_020155 [Caranx melampygus]|nr:hypothetical protein INR49_020155 [Caranx melampygus]
MHDRCGGAGWGQSEVVAAVVMVLDSGESSWIRLRVKASGGAGTFWGQMGEADPRKSTSGFAAAARPLAKKSNVAKKEKVSHNGLPAQNKLQPGREEVVVERGLHTQTSAPPNPSA